MDSLDRDYAAGIFNNPEPPCLSLYQATHRVHPDNEQDPIRFRNLVKELEHSLRRDYSSRDIRHLIEPIARTRWRPRLLGFGAHGAGCARRGRILPRLPSSTRRPGAGHRGRQLSSQTAAPHFAIGR